MFRATFHSIPLHACLEGTIGVEKSFLVGSVKPSSCISQQPEGYIWMVRHIGKHLIPSFFGTTSSYLWLAAIISRIMVLYDPSSCPNHEPIKLNGTRWWPWRRSYCSVRILLIVDVVMMITVDRHGRSRIRQSATQLHTCYQLMIVGQAKAYWRNPQRVQETNRSTLERTWWRWYQENWWLLSRWPFTYNQAS